ncbi:MAG TPA: histidine kinase [Anaerolineae bacterium]|nr:histidine kinase [Anaerolineae bacterium]
MAGSSKTRQLLSGLRLRGLTLQLFVFIILPLAALLIAIPLGSLTVHQRAMRGLVGERDERAARATADSITEQINHRAAAVRGLALRAADSVSPEQVVADYAFLLPDFEGGLALFGPDGDVLAASNTPGAWPSRPVADLLARARSQTEPPFSDVFIDAVSSEPMMLVASAAADGTAAVGGFFPASLARRVLTHAFPPDSQVSVLIVDSQARLLYQWDDSLRETDPAQHPGVAEALRGESGTLYRQVEGSEHVVAFSPVPPVGWALVIEEPWEIVYSPLLRTTLAAPLILIPVLLFALVALGFGIRQIVQPLRALEQKTTQLAGGQFDAVESPVGGIAEIRSLQDSLIQMARKLKTAQQRLRDYAAAILRSQEDERSRLARELHDESVQALVALNQRVQMAERALARDPQAAPARLAELRTMTAAALEDVRRVIRALRPIYLDDLGLLPALETLTQTIGREGGLITTFEVEGESRRLTPERELALYRIVQEALHNVARHAKAKHVQVKLRYDHALCVSVADDGIGFDVPERVDAMVDLAHFGLVGMRERAEVVGARLEIRSAPGSGTTVELYLPL